MSPQAIPMQISRRVAAIPEALSIHINQLVADGKKQGRDIITLSLGEAFFELPAMDLSPFQARGAHYSDSRGILELRQKIAAHYWKQYTSRVDPATEIIISAGSKPLIFMAMQAVLNPGDEVLIHEPAWLSYQEQLKLLDAVPVFIPYDCPPEKFHTYLTARTKMLIINNPNNPGGFIYTEKELKGLYSDLYPKGVYMLVDEAYSDFVAEGSFYSAASLSPDKNGVIVVNSLSKNFGISGWRIGYVISSETLGRHLLKLNQHLITCAPSVLMLYLADHFEELFAHLQPQIAACVAKRENIRAYMDEIGLKYCPGHSTFYFFVNIAPFRGSSMDFALNLLAKEAVAVVPGSAYGQSTDQFVRVSVGTESEDRIRSALRLIKDRSSASEKCDSRP